jgi:ribonuclease D
MDIQAPPAWLPNILFASVVLATSRILCARSNRPEEKCRPRIGEFRIEEIEATRLQQLVRISDTHVRGVLQIVACAGTAVLPVESVQLVYVNTLLQLKELQKVLERPETQAFGIDVEHTTKGSFHGYVCTIQISVWHPHQCDFVIDCLVADVHAGVGTALQNAFLDASKVKIMHGATNDVRWLASNFGLYLVGLVDTAVAARATPQYASAFALGTLLTGYFAISTDKRWQRADWRTRPLPAQQLAYARTDTRYLAPLLHRLLNNEHVDTPKVAGVLEKSAAVTHTRFSAQDSERFDTNRALTGIARAHASNCFGDDKGLVTAVRLAKWRHALAQQIDTDLQSILEDAALLAIAQQVATLVVCTSQFELDLQTLVSLDFFPRLLDEVKGILVCSAEQLRAEALQIRGSRSKTFGSTDSPATMREAAKAARAMRVFVPRSSPLYNNIELMAPDGTVIARIDQRKAQWYIDAGAVDVLSGPELRKGSKAEDGSSLQQLRMKQQPKGLGHAGDSFHLGLKLNKCVVCGVDWDSCASVGGISRCYIIPHAYRQYFPLAAKSYTSHDVVLTCAACHRKADVSSAAMVKMLAHELKVSLHGKSKSRSQQATVSIDDVILDIKRAASTLANASHRPPPARIEELSATLLRHKEFAACILRADHDADFDVLSLDNITTLAKMSFAAAKKILLPDSAASTLEQDEEFNPAAEVMRHILLGTPEWHAAEPSFPPLIMPSCNLCGSAVAPSLASARCACGRALGADESVATTSGMPAAAEQRLTRFVQRWRAHFLATVNPLSMPEGWSVNYRVFQAGLRKSNSVEPTIVQELLSTAGCG